MPTKIMKFLKKWLTMESCDTRI